MTHFVPATLLVFVNLVKSDCHNKEYDQCGGQGFPGETCCPTYDNCTYVNPYYSQCQPKDLCLNPVYGQCGGYDHNQPPRPWNSTYHHQTCCPDSFLCLYQNEYYSQCVYDPANTTCSLGYKQCGGDGWSGPTCCIPGFACQPDPVNPKYYSGCVPVPVCSNARYGQCGGIGPDGEPWDRAHEHDTCCPDGFACIFDSQYYSQCKPNMTAVLELR